ncbi:MAG: hypothetical protein CVU57_06260, partial [Deltaproteobacteria bacterium HGW-Deltaproteobacteria-15]
MGSERVVSVHGDSYENFWHKTFPSMLEESLCRVMNGCGGMISFGPGVSELELHFDEDITAQKPEALCQELNLDYTQTISCILRFDRSSEPHTIRLGRIPKETNEGNFIINGKERAIIAQLRRGPGLTFRREEMVRSYRNPDGGKYAVDKIRYSARLIPNDGVWLEFDTFKTPEEQKGLLPLQIWESITGKDGSISVRVRRDGWFSAADLFRSLGIEPPSDIPLGEPNHAVKHGEVGPEESEEEEREDWGEGDEWRKIGQCVGVRAEKKRENEVEQKKRIREELLDRNYLSELGRYQVNRRLSRISGHVPQSSPSLTAEDIEGICRYLSGLCNGLDLPVDDKYSLADKRVRLIGDLLKEEIVPRALRHLERSVKRKVDYRTSKTLEAGEFAKLVERSILGCDTFRTIRKQLFAVSELSHIVPRENLLERKAIHRRITLFGPGGISSTHVKEVRDLHWTHCGRLCPVDTPQSDRLGLTLSTPLEARISHLGLIEVPLHRVISLDNGNMQIQEDEVVYLSAAQEEDEKSWIAYFDQREALCSGKAVWARCGSMEYQPVDSRNIRYIDAFPHQQFSLAARLVPFLQHNDANRVLMACSAMRQALPLKEPEPPLVQTGYERILADGRDARGLGKNLLVAYMPYNGLNFEDAVVISESASRKLEHVQRFDYSVEIKETTVVTDQDTGNPKRKTVRQEITRDIHCSDARKNKLDKVGIIRKGEWVEPGDVLVGIVDPHLRESMSLFQMAAMALRKGTVSPGDQSFRVPKGEWGRVVEVNSISADPGYRLPRGVRKIVRIQVESPPKPLKVGDKVANRHGGKGVVSVIQPDEEMPYFNDPWSHHEHDGLLPHTHVEMVLNPLGVISRLNLGQLYETHMGWFAHRAGRGPLEPIPPFSDSLGILKHAYQERLAPLDHNGQAYLTDPLTKEQTKASVTIGYAYMLKLNHLAEKKVHGRGFAMHKYSAVSQQPLQGKRREGGQRVGEMEICALEAHNARHIIQEMITLKSDNPSGRELLYHAQKFGGRSSEPSPGQPGFLKVLALYLLCCGLKLDFLDSQGNPIDFLNPKWPIRPERVSEVGIRPASRSDIAHFSAGSISNPDSGTERGGYTDDGIFSQTIFGPLLDWTCRCGVIHPSSPASTGRCEKCGVEITSNEVRRLRIGHIDLPHPVFNVSFMHVASRLLGISTESLKGFLIDEPHVSFGKKTDALLFIGLLLVASEEFRTHFEKRMKLGGSSYNSDYPSLKKLLWDKRLDSIRAIIDEGLSKSGSSITLLGRLLSSFTEERLREIRVVLVDELIALMRKEKGTARQEQIKKRLEVIDSFLRSHIPVSHLMIEVMPVLPPGLRPPLVMENGAVVMGDLNHLYEDLLKFLKAMKLEPQADFGRNDIRE